MACARADDGERFARDLLDRVGVSVLPGGGFGELTKHYVRLSLTHDLAILEQAFDRIAQFTDH